MEMNTEAVRLANEWGREEARLLKDIRRLNKANDCVEIKKKGERP